MDNSFDAVVIGGGSVGLPTAYYLSERGLKVIVVEELSQVGQGQNKSAIGGIRATHSDPTKIEVCRESLDIYRNFAGKHKLNIEWKEGGYCFPVYREEEEETLKNILPIQKKHGLNINWVDPDTIKKLIPGVNAENLRGGTYSPEDGDLSPLRVAYGWYRIAEKIGCKFVFNEKVTGMIIEGGKVKGVKTNKNMYYADTVINASGANASEVGKLAGIDLPVEPDSHEAGITSPYEEFISPLVVDLRPGEEGKTSNFYFAQNKLGQIIFCYTPKYLFKGKDRTNTSEFMPIIARRLIGIVPKFKELLIRRTWRGLYPMTPDGSPIVDKVDDIDGLYLAVGMCGQGLMLGPGIAVNLVSLILDGTPVIDPELFAKWRLNRSWVTKEALK